MIFKTLSTLTACYEFTIFCETADVLACIGYTVLVMHGDASFQSTRKRV